MFHFNVHFCFQFLVNASVKTFNYSSFSRLIRIQIEQSTRYHSSSITYAQNQMNQSHSLTHSQFYIFENYQTAVGVLLIGPFLCVKHVINSFVRTDRPIVGHCWFYAVKIITRSVVWKTMAYQWTSLCRFLGLLRFDES